MTHHKWFIVTISRTVAAVDEDEAYDQVNRMDIGDLLLDAEIEEREDIGDDEELKRLDAIYGLTDEEDEDGR